jgi:hypothetical protein
MTYITLILWGSFPSSFFADGYIFWKEITLNDLDESTTQLTLEEHHWSWEISAT